MTCRRSPCTLSSRVIGRSSQSGSPATGWFTLGTIGQMALTVSGHKCQHYSGSGHSRRRGDDTMATAQTPRGINHVVLNVRDIEVSHRFWTEIMGFRCVAQLKSRPDRVRPKMRFYSGVSESGDVTHHDLALAEAPQREGENDREAETWSLMRGGGGLNHVAIAWPDREAGLKQVEHLREKGVIFHRRINHGMNHREYISAPDCPGITEHYVLLCTLRAATI